MDQARRASWSGGLPGHLQVGGRRPRRPPDRHSSAIHSKRSPDAGPGHPADGTERGQEVHRSQQRGDKDPDGGTAPGYITTCNRRTFLSAKCRCGRSSRIPRPAAKRRVIPAWSITLIRNQIKHFTMELSVCYEPLGSLDRTVIQNRPSSHRKASRSLISAPHTRRP